MLVTACASINFALVAGPALQTVCKSVLAGTHPMVVDVWLPKQTLQHCACTVQASHILQNMFAGTATISSKLVWSDWRHQNC